MKKQTPRNRLLTLTQLGVIQDYLPRGVRTQLAHEFGVSNQYIGQVIKGKGRGEAILLRALPIALAEKKRIEERNKKVYEQMKELAK